MKIRHQLAFSARCGRHSLVVYIPEYSTDKKCRSLQGMNIKSQKCPGHWDKHLAGDIAVSLRIMLYDI